MLGGGAAARGGRGAVARGVADDGSGGTRTACAGARRAESRDLGLAALQLGAHRQIELLQIILLSMSNLRRKPAAQTSRNRTDAARNLPGSRFPVDLLCANLVIADRSNLSSRSRFATCSSHAMMD